YAVLAFGPGSTEEDGRRLIAALEGIAEDTDGEPADASAVCASAAGFPGQELAEPIRFSRRLPPCDAVPLEEAAGCIAGEWIIPYPPGVPLLVPGERITERHVSELIRWREGGAGIQGAADPGLRTLLAIRGT